MIKLGQGFKHPLSPDEGYNGCVIVLDDELSTISAGNNLITAGGAYGNAFARGHESRFSTLVMCAGILEPLVVRFGECGY